MSKRSLAAEALRRTGALSLLEHMRSKPGLLIVTHHRVGNAAASRFDRAIFSASADAFDRQVKYFKRHLSVIGGEELEAIAAGRQKLTRMHVAFTFDDGYVNDYRTTFDILKANDCTGSFFLVPEYVGTATVPWWDEIAYLVRNTARTSLSLTYPAPLTVTIGTDREAAIVAVLRHYKLPSNHDGNILLEQLREQAGCELPHVGRRFITWEEAREMRAAGMTIGSHTQTHRLLGQLTPEEQHWELAESKRVIEENIGAPVTSVAYPVGIRGAFDEHTERITRELGYNVGFSFYGGVNTPEHMQPTNLLRISTNPDWLLFRAETVLLSRLGSLPY
ncbi:MAG: polysaccharide deacetylase family protein [Edaphobacter sp.]|uniref:polysaccharide deacetylase family protein n=1 Tax=Edaphobacter sp. TaxID=1934404 RepID=UPI0023926FFF|nr:polysaccharide deacetylase family protein [Edaphobacter sp.]MDE1178174.1 polysaccharide deacetylase family protein [Edaphobacter sp.]